MKKKIRAVASLFIMLSMGVTTVHPTILHNYICAGSSATTSGCEPSAPQATCVTQSCLYVKYSRAVYQCRPVTNGNDCNTDFITYPEGTGPTYKAYIKFCATVLFPYGVIVCLCPPPLAGEQPDLQGEISSECAGVS
jgi:hypothetical protein